MYLITYDGAIIHTYTHTHTHTHCCGWLKMESMTWLVGRFLRGMRICACVYAGVWRRRRRGRRKRRGIVLFVCVCVLVLVLTLE
jgi:hypothetical protein